MHSSYIKHALKKALTVALSLAAIVLISSCGKSSEKDSMRQIFILYGPPGCGKGTLADQAEKTGMIKFTAGDALRKFAAESKSDAALKVKEIQAKGGLVPNEMINTMVREWLAKQSKSTAPIIFDGYPRTLEQAAALIDLLNQSPIGQYRITVIRFTVSENEIVNRVAYRLTCSNKSCQKVYSITQNPPKVAGKCDVCGSPLVQRPEDTPETARARYRTYMEGEQAILAFFTAHGIPVKQVSAEQPIPKVYEAFTKIVAQA